jgi:hypothetical protein
MGAGQTQRGDGVAWPALLHVESRQGRERAPRMTAPAQPPLDLDRSKIIGLGLGVEEAYQSRSTAVGPDHRGVVGKPGRRAGGVKLPFAVVPQSLERQPVIRRGRREPAGSLHLPDRRLGVVEPEALEEGPHFQLRQGFVKRLDVLDGLDGLFVAFEALCRARHKASRGYPGWNCCLITGYVSFALTDSIRFP